MVQDGDPLPAGSAPLRTPLLGSSPEDGVFEIQCLTAGVGHADLGHQLDRPLVPEIGLSKGLGKQLVRIRFRGGKGRGSQQADNQ